ncbi:MAG: bifunctional demethylmenaquinone methyltransferase/2-methoxy-6-polyprenyl-1,4-benzoquinol methylase UbiE [Flavobacteriales bacterium]|nr:bifunctional demethylmenaquinone methyltransferase/2-methoxy-6-polyprenyl-1,4-benzoquinol methylase UbiE [Flavobacteriales bacterium]
MGTKITPYKNKEATKKAQVAKMFDNIAGSYDFLNHFLSLGIDILWRKRAVREIGKISPKTILDIATGTGDLAVEASVLKPTKIVGVDISEGMLEVGRKKMKTKGLDLIIELQSGDSENLPFEDNSFDAVTAGFGVRNFENLPKGLSEMHRVMNKGGKLAILEPAEPNTFPFKQLYSLYFKWVLPLVGKLVSKDNAAYTYLPESVAAFPSGQAFLKELEIAGFKNPQHIKLTFGVAALYTATK